MGSHYFSPLHIYWGSYGISLFLLPPTHLLASLLLPQMFLQLLEVEETQRKMSLLPEEQHPRFHEKKSHEVGRIYQALKIRACDSEE